MKVALKRTVIATSTVACVALLSFSWSEQRGVSLGVESAQARVVDRRPHSALPGLHVDSTGGLSRGRIVRRGRSRRHHLAVELR